MMTGSIRHIGSGSCPGNLVATKGLRAMSLPTRILKNEKQFKGETT